MQPNQPFSPMPSQDNDSQPQITPTSQPPQWNTAPQTPLVYQQPQQQPSTPSQSVAPVDNTQYQPQPQPITPTAPDQYTQPQQPATAPIQPASPSQQDYVQPQQAISATPVAPTEYNQAPAPVAPVSMFEQGYQASLNIPVPKKSRLGLIIAGTVAAVLLIGGGVAAFMWMQYTNSPQQRLYRALDSHMTTTLIQQDYVQSIDLGEKIETNIQATSNFTDPKSPQSYMKYAVKLAGKTSFAGELTVLDDKEYFGKLSQQPDGFAGATSQYQPVPKQWYRVDAGDFGGVMFLDPASLSKNVNVPTGEVIVGNFEDKARQELMTFIKEKNVYTIVGSEDTTLNDQNATRIDLNIDADQLKELNKKAMAALGVSEDKINEKTAPKNQTSQLWISHKTGRITKAEMTWDSTVMGGNGSKTKDVSTVNISYPTSAATITKPEGAKETPWKSLLN